MHERGFREIIAPTELALDRVKSAAGQTLITGGTRSPGFGLSQLLPPIGACS